jgi:hypothetical protein
VRQPKLEMRDYLGLKILQIMRFFSKLLEPVSKIPAKLWVRTLTFFREISKSSYAIAQSPLKLLRSLPDRLDPGAKQAMMQEKFADLLRKFAELPQK